MITGSKCEEISYCGNSFGSFNVKQFFFTFEKQGIGPQYTEYS